MTEQSARTVRVEGLDDAQCDVVNVTLLLMEERLAAWAQAVTAAAVQGAGQVALTAAGQVAAQHLVQGSARSESNAADLREVLREAQADAVAAALAAVRPMRKDVLRDVHGDIVSIVERPDMDG